MQNGIPEQKVASIVGDERVIAGSVEFGATFIEPGVSRLTTEYTQFKEYAFQIENYMVKQQKESCVLNRF